MRLGGIERCDGEPIRSEIVVSHPHEVVGGYLIEQIKVVTGEIEVTCLMPVGGQISSASRGGGEDFELTGENLPTGPVESRLQFAFEGRGEFGEDGLLQAVTLIMIDLRGNTEHSGAVCGTPGPGSDVMGESLLLVEAAVEVGRSPSSECAGEQFKGGGIRVIEPRRLPRQGGFADRDGERLACFPLSELTGFL